MYCLFLDTTQDYCHIAIFINNKIIRKISIQTHNNLTDLMVEHIDKLIKASRLEKQDIKSIYILNGPGSFTGIRVSNLIAKTWSLVFNAKIFVLDSLRFQIPTNSGISILDARGNKYYVLVIKNNKEIVKPRLVDEKQLNQITNKYKSLEQYHFYKDVDVLDNLLINIQRFKSVKSINNLKSLYVKPALS